ncbi:MAG: exosortase-associated EpsI family protein [Fuerstiella sp.]
MTHQPISRRDLLLMGSGLAILLIGRFTDGAINGTGTADASALQHAVARLEDIPQDIQNWTSVDGTLSEREQEVAGISGYVRRQYRNARTGYTVHLTVLCGPAGPISVHPPTACFEGIGYSLATGPAQTTVRTGDQSPRYEFNTSSFRQRDVSVPEIVRVFWGWGQDGTWTAPSNPRFEFRGQPYLYKIYVTDRRLDAPDTTTLPRIEAFLKDALPTLHAALSGQPLAAVSASRAEPAVAER